MNHIRIVSTYPPRRCGLATFSRDLATALGHFTGEVGSIRISALDRNNMPYDIPVDLVIDQYNPKSWRDGVKDILTRARERTDPTAVLLQHEYGLDPDEQGNDGEGTHYVQMARALTEGGLTTLVYLHTVLDNPNSHQATIMRDLAQHSDGLIVTTESAVQILEQAPYRIDRNKLKHIDHGVRMHHRSEYDRLACKETFGLAGRFLVTTLGMLSPDKGIQFGLRAYGRFLAESCTTAQRRQTVYVIAGQCHPEFVKTEGGQPYREFQAELKLAMDASDLHVCKVPSLMRVDFDACDVIFLDTFLDEATLLQLYGATNIMLLPYLNQQQISSGILADTLGSGRVAVTTKFRYALELIHSNKRVPEGLVVGRHARGILVDSGEPSVEQMAQALDLLVFNRDRRLAMEREAHQRGYQMRWQNTAWALLQHIEFIQDRQNHRCGRGPIFPREKSSVYQRPSASRQAIETSGLKPPILRQSQLDVTLNSA
ncbi:MAG: hypothetical protein HQ515_02330 [Phycisphaeraceae bacterium]|nr:hypothetical protein [Phycisphaeraceae bacterium]